MNKRNRNRWSPNGFPSLPNTPWLITYSSSTKIMVQCLMALLISCSFAVTVSGQIASPIVSFEGHSGILIPRLSTDAIASIPDPVDGLLVYDTTLNHFCFFSSNSGSWRRLSVVESPVDIDPVTRIDGSREINLAPHQPSFQAEWNVQGNIGANNYSDDPPLLGTTDASPVVFITDDQERMRILTDGNITVVRSVEIGEDLTVKQNVTLNTTGGQTMNIGDFTSQQDVFLNTVGGATINNGDFTVENQSTSLLTGRLFVNQKTQLNLGLEVFGATKLHGNFTVDNSFPSLLTGQTTISDLTGSDSAAISSGALVVGGGVGIGQNLNVGGNLAIGGTAAFGGEVSFASPVTITAEDQSNDVTSGALIVGGGAGIGKNLNVGGDTDLGGTLDVLGNFNVNTNKLTVAATSGNTGIAGTLSAAGNFAINTDKFTVAASNGNTLIGGTLGVTGLATLNGGVQANGQVTVNANPSGGQSSFGGYPLRVQGSTQGIAIKVTGSRTNDNNFISFWDDNAMWGRIEGETEAEFTNNADYNFDQRTLDFDIASAAIDVVFATNDLIVAVGDVVMAASSSTACAGFGVCITTPILSFIIGEAAQLVIAIAQEVVVIAYAVVAGTNKEIYDDNKVTLQGVTYATGAGDYAEYLLRSDVNEQMVYGDIVGVKGGKVTRNTTGAERMLVVSRKPMVLGAMPQPEREKEYEKIAFMGQVPVKVFGKVNIGDYIIPLGYNNGVGKAVSPSEIRTSDISKIVGVAWSASDDPVGVKMINVAVGLNTNDIVRKVEKLESQFDELQQHFAETNKILTQLIPDYKAPVSTYSTKTLTELNQLSSKATRQNDRIETQFMTSDDTDVVYQTFTREDMEKSFDLARKLMEEQGTDTKNHEFWKQVDSNATFKEMVMQRLNAEFVKAVEQNQRIDAGE